MVYLNSHVASQLSITLEEEESAFGRTTGNLSYLGIVECRVIIRKKMRSCPWSTWQHTAGKR